MRQLSQLTTRIFHGAADFYLLWVGPAQAASDPDLSELENKLVDSFTTSFTSIGYNKISTVVSFRIPLGTEQKIVKTVLSAYKTYAKLTPIPKIGLVIDYEKGKITDVSSIISEIISLGGKVMFTKHNISQKGIVCKKNQQLCGKRFFLVPFEFFWPFQYFFFILYRVQI